jgi:hypothetical protein
MFHRCQNKEEVEKLYKRLAKRLHPDCGGEHDLMVLLKENYESALNHTKGHAASARFYDARDARPPTPSDTSPKTNEKIPINDGRLAFVKEIRKLLKRLKPDSPVIPVIKSLDDNQFLTAAQYEWLKSLWQEATRP